MVDTMFGWDQQDAAGVVVVLVCLSALGAGGGLVHPTTATGATTQTTGADTNVAFTYLNGGDVTLVTESGTQHDLGVTAATVGTAKDLNGDGYVEIPYVTSNNELYLINRNGTKTHLASNAATAKVAVGNLSGGTDKVFYIDTDNSLNAVTVGGSVDHVVNPSDSLVAVAGVADLTGDDQREVVYTGGSTIRYYNGTDVEFDTDGASGSGTAIGAPRDFNGDGKLRVPIVDGSGNVVLVDSTGTAETVLPTGAAAAAPVAGVNWTGTAAREVLYIDGSTVEYTTLDGTTGTVASISSADTDAGVAWAQDADAPLALSNFTLSNNSGTLQASFDSNSDLASLDVTIDGPDGESLALSEFNETSTDGGYTYVGNYTPTADGNYTATLNAATATDGDTATPEDTDTATIDTRFNVTALNATANGLDVNISFNATETLSGVSVDIAGAETDTLDLSNFSTASSTSPYVYTGTYNASTAGEYNVTLTQATSTDGQVADENLSDSALTDEPLDVWNFTLANETDGIHVAFNASEQLRETTVAIDGPTNTTLTDGNFTETATGDGYAYETTYETSEIGTYNGTLERAESTDGDTVTPALTATATLGDVFDVTNLTATARAGDLQLAFETTHQLAGVTVDIGGAETTTLTLDAFSTNDSSPTYTYTGGYAANTTGRYNVTLTDATATDGQTHTDPLTDTARIAPLVTNTTLTDATNGNAVVNESDRVTITATVSSAAATVTADAAAFGAGSVPLSAVNETTYRATIDVAVTNVTESRHVRVSVTGMSGREASDTTNTVLVDTEPPIVDVGANRTVDAGANVSLSPVDATDPTSRIVAYDWSVGGAHQRGETITTSFDTPGNYTVRLAVTDAAGNVGADRLTVTAEGTSPTATSTAGGVTSDDGDDDGFVDGDTTTTAAQSTTTRPPQTTTPSGENSELSSQPTTTTTGATTTSTTPTPTTVTSSRPPRHNVEMPFGSLFGVTGSTTVLAVIAALLLVRRRRSDG